MPKIINEILNKTFFDVSVQDFIVACGLILFFYFLRKPLSRFILGILKQFAKKTTSSVDDKIIKALEDPFKFSFIILGFYCAFIWLDLKGLKPLFTHIISSLIVFVLFWTLYRLICEFNSVITLFSSRLGKPLNKDIENFIIKTLKVLIVITGFLMFLQAWGLNVTTFIASLGLGGLAFALAAKDTAANLFGSLVIFADRPFQVGDWVEIDKIEGNIEEIGIRSTRIRTFSQSLVTIPNAKVANTSIVNWTRMGKRRVKGVLGLTYATTSNQIEAILQDLQVALNEHGGIYEDGIILTFESFGDSTLNILYQYFTITTAYSEFTKIRQEINITFMHIIEKHGSSFAFPSQSLYIENLPQNNQIQK